MKALEQKGIVKPRFKCVKSAFDPAKLRMHKRNKARLRKFKLNFPDVPIPYTQLEVAVVWAVVAKPTRPFAVSKTL